MSKQQKLAKDISQKPNSKHQNVAIAQASKDVRSVVWVVIWS